MKFKQCKYCKEEIAKTAKRCPNCGGRLGMPGIVKALIIIVIIFACIAGCASSCSNAIEEVANSYKDINGKTKFKLNETFENKYEKITMLEVNTNFTDYNEYLGPKDGYKVIAVKFEAENIGDDDTLYYSILEFKAYADGVACEEYLYASDKFNALNAELGKGKRAIGYVLYEVPVDASKIVIEYDGDFWTDGNAIEFIVQ